MIMKILIKGMIYMKMLKKGGAVEKRGGGNEIHAPCACASVYLLIRNEGVKIPWGFNLPYRGSVFNKGGQNTI
jgi:hypothetical protein